MKNNLDFGASYYPEQLATDEVDRDARLMQEAGFTLARMGEFAWSRMEPDDNAFDFSWLEHAVETLGRAGVKSLLGTPTAAPPKWLTDKHPDILQIMGDGHCREFGRRRHYCVNSPTYHRYTERIVRVMVEQFKDNPNVMGYQLDNEFMAEQPHCYCATCRKMFQEWLRKKYGTIDELNRRWGMAFWSQHYRNFDEVILPKVGQNPSSLLDHYRFFSDSFLNYARLQSDCIKRISPEKTVTHNVCSSGFLYLLDLYKLGDQLDIVSLDNYPFTWTLENEYGNAGDQNYHPAMASFALSLTRGLKRGPFWVTEAQTGRTFKPRQLPEPGMINVWTHQEIAHGAKAVLWFHWRQFPAGIEHLLQAVLECDGKPRRRYFEIQKTVSDLQSVSKDLEPSCPKPEVAILRDFDCDWALDDGHTHPDFRYMRHLYLYYKALFEQHVNADVVNPSDDLSRYKLIFAPSLLIMDEARAAHLRRYVEQGGTLVFTVQSGLRNRDNVFHRQTLPAYLTDLCGIEIEEQNGLKFQDTTGIAPLAGTYTKPRYACSFLFEIIKPTTATTLFTYTDHWFAGTSAVTVNRFGKGTVYYIAAVPSLEFITEFMATILPACNVKPNLTSSSSPMVESVKSVAGAREHLHLINYTRQPQTVVLSDHYTNLTDDSKIAGLLELPPFGAVILQKTNQEQI
ncbi:MAG: beta-galactosidase [bacterium]